MAFTFWAAPSLLAFLMSMGVGIYVLYRKPESAVNRAFAVWMAFFALWNLGKIGMFSAEDPSGALLWAKFAYVGFLFIAPAFAYFVARLLDRKINALFLYLPFILFLATLPTDLFIKDVRLQAWGYHFYYGDLFLLFGLAFLPLVAHAGRSLLEARKAVKKPLVREKLDLIIFPAMAALSFLGVSEIVLPAMGIYVYSLSGVFTAIMSASIAYAFLLKK